ncbi:MAG TPA: hypothetical protein VNP95_06905, partial [Thermomicrobiales bacterium]|nr:hypothetical protein [Thermomicrobiales bacterium]
MSATTSTATSADSPPDTRAIAREAGLTFSHIDRPGITRHKAGTGVFYRDAHGERITDEATLARVKALAIPP